MNTGLTIRRPGRAAAVVGAVVAVSATTMMALVAGTASASEPGRCTENVNVRAEPDINSRIVALCEAGTNVQVGESRDGFVQLIDLGGWSAQEYVSVNGAPAAAPAPRAAAAPTPGVAAAPTTTTAPFGAPRPEAAMPVPTTTTAPVPAPAAGARSAPEPTTTGSAPRTVHTFPQRTPEPTPERSPLGGLLG